MLIRINTIISFFVVGIYFYFISEGVYASIIDTNGGVSKTVLIYVLIFYTWPIIPSIVYLFLKRNKKTNLLLNWLFIAFYLLFASLIYFLY